jgi:hypothetical protein
MRRYFAVGLALAAFVLTGSEAAAAKATGPIQIKRL